MINRIQALRLRALPAPQNVVLAGVVAVMAVTFAVIIATLNRGFDASDEGFVYAMIASNRLSTTEFWGFQYLLNPIYELLGESVLAFRVLRLLGYVALGVVLTLLARLLLRSRAIELGRIGWTLVALVAQVGTLAAWSYPPRYLGYNELSSWFTQLGAALVIFLLLEGNSARGNRFSSRWWTWSIAGVVLSVLLVAKISAGVFLVPLAIVASLLATSDVVWWKRTAALAGGLVAGLGLMLLTGIPLLSYVATSAKLGGDPSAQAESGYSITSLLATYLTSMATTVGALAVPILLAGIMLVVVRGIRTETETAYPDVRAAENVTLFLGFVLAVVLVSITVIPSALDTWASLGVSNAFLLAIAILSFAVLVSSSTRAAAVERRRPFIVIAFAIGLFAITPLISALGTNNRIFGHTVFSATMWAVGAAVGLVLLWQRSAAISAAVRVLPVLLLGVIVVASGLAVAGDVFLHPYRTSPYFMQKSTLEVGDLRGIRLTEDEANLYTWLNEAGQQLDADGVPTLSIASPGALLAFNASGWSAIWPGPAWASSITQSCTDDLPNDLIVLQAASEEKGTPGYDRLVAGLSACEITFPSDFEVVDHYSSEEPLRDVQIWRLR